MVIKSKFLLRDIWVETKMIQKKISVNVKLKTKKQLKMWGVKYHELIFGKPSYDIIVDDKSILYNKKKTIIKLKKFLI